MSGPKPSKFPPAWWQPSLYDFVKPDMELEAWVWEFMRRQRLRYLLPKDQPVDAMNPDPATTGLEAMNSAYYYPWYKAKEKFSTPYNDWPFYLSPSVIAPAGLYPKTFCTQYFKARTFVVRWDENNEAFISFEPFPRFQKKFKIDLTRPDSAIKRDFANALKAVREVCPAPPKQTPKPAAWFKQHLLQVWDLRQYNVSWNIMGELSPLFSVSERESLEKDLGIDFSTQSWADIFRLMKDKYGFKEQEKISTKEPLTATFRRAKELINEAEWYLILIQHDAEKKS